MSSKFNLLWRAMLVTVGVLTANISRADLASSKTWSQNWSATFSQGGYSWTVDQTSPCWLLSDPSNYLTWLLSLKGTSGNYDIVLLGAPSSSSSAPDDIVVLGIGYTYIKGERQDFMDLLPNDNAYFLALARRDGSISTPTLHGVGSSLAPANVLSFDNYGTTFYVGTDQSSFDGVSNYIGKCKNGTWVNMEFGVGCNTCLNPQVTSVSVNSSGTVVTIQGNFQKGYTWTSPYEYFCSTWGLIYFHNDSSMAHEGFWSNSP